MTQELSQPTPSGRMSRILGLATGFGALHALHTAMNLGFTLLQLLVLARLLDQPRYAEIVFLTAVGLYIQPADQAIGRANYMALRPAAAGMAGAARGAVVWSLAGQACLLLLLSFVVPLWFGTDDPVRYLGNALFLFGCLFTNYWSFDLQSTAWAADLGRRFAFVSILRRLAFLAALGLFWLTGDFLLYGAATTIVIVLFMAVVLRDARHAPLLAAGPASTARTGLLAYWKQFWASLAFALSELLVLNSPYAVLTALFGVGPVLVVFDSVMKVARLAMAGTRTLAEIFLPRISRQLIDGERAEAQRGLWRVTLLCAAATAIPAGAVLFFSPLVFDLLLGPNNVVPPEAAPAAALIIMVSGFYQPATLFLSYLNARRLVLGVAIFASAGAAVAAAIMLIGRFEAAGLLWIYAGFFAAVSGFALLQSRRIEPWEVAREA